MAVKFDATSDMSKVFKDYDKLQRENVALQEKMRKVTAEAKATEGGFKSAFEGGINSAKSMVGSYLSIQGAIALVNQGLAEQKRISDDIHRVQMSAADAQMEVTKNLGGVSTEQATKFLKDIEGISQKTGMASVAPVYQAAAQIFSAVGREDVTLSVLQNALPFFKAKPDELPAFGGAVADLAKIAGETTPEGLKKITALVLSSQKYSRGATLDTQKEVSMAVAAFGAVDTSMDRVNTLREGLAFTSAISQAIADPDLALTKTAAAEVATALAELLPDKDVLDAAGGIKRQGTGMKTTLERLRAVQADAGLQRRFFETGEGFQMASFRGPIAPVIKQLVADKQSPIAKSLEEALGGITQDTAVVDQINRNLVAASPQMQTADIVRRAAGRVEGVQLGSDAGKGAAATEIVNKALDISQTGFLDAVFRPAYAARLSGLGSAGKMDRAEGIIKERIAAVATETGGGFSAYRQRFTGLDEDSLPEMIAGLNETGREQVTALYDLLTEIRNLRATTTGEGAKAAATMHMQREGR